MNEQFIIKEDTLDYKPSAGGLGFEFYYCMKYNENRTAQICADTDKSETFGQLLKKSIRTALKLKSLGVVKKDIISICSHNHINAVVPFVACQLLGCIAASLDPSQSVEEYIYLLRKVNPKIIFVANAALNKILDALQRINLCPMIVVFGKTDLYNILDFENFLVPHLEEDDFQPAKIDNVKDTAIIYFSSGTTGLPKGICLHHFGLMSQIINLIHRHALPDEVHMSNYCEKEVEPEENFAMLSYSSLYWISSIWVFIRSVFTGQARVLCKCFDPDEWWNLVDKYNIFYFSTHQVQIEAIFSSFNAKKKTIKSLKICSIGETTVTESLMKKALQILPHSTRIVQAYGQTESAGLLTCFSATECERGMQRKKPLSCGKVFPGFLCKVIDLDTGLALGPNKIGEFVYKSEYSMSGYYNEDNLEAFDENGWLKSGDAVYYDKEFCFYLVDRLKDIFKYRNWNIVPASLENLLLSHSEVKLAVVIGIPHVHDKHRPMGLVVLKEKATVTSTELEKFVEDKVFEWQKLRGGVKIVKEIPCTVTGKISRKMVKDMVLNKKL